MALPRVQPRLALRRALVCLDTETTGVNPDTSRIVSLACLREEPDGRTATFATLVNPGEPIPPEASAIHGITDAMVASAPPFRDIAPALRDFLGDADLVGFGIQRFDVPLLLREFDRTGIPFDLGDRIVIDVKSLYHRLRPRTLSDAYREFTGRELDGAHGALADTRACREVLDAMLAAHPDLPADVLALGEPAQNPEWVDPFGKLAWKDGEIVFRFGKYDGVPLRHVLKTDRSYLEWMASQAQKLPASVKSIIANALAGRFPEPPE
jgi:DNA polymerase-3 subunit epsilon